MEQEFKTCVRGHGPIKSSYPRDKVPAYLFRKNPDDVNSPSCKQCYHCRVYGRALDEKRYAKKKSLVRENKELVSKGFVQFIQCPSNIHDSKSGSPYPGTAVPIERFRKYPDDVRSDLNDVCLDCSRHKNLLEKLVLEQKRSNAEKNGVFFCEWCKKSMESDKQGRNRDGSPSVLCLDCQAKQVRDQPKKVEKRKKYYTDIIYEFIIKHECSCYKCKRLYFAPDLDTLIVPYLETYLNAGGERMVQFNSIEYRASDIITQCIDFLELAVIELDHLTEKEQRERGILAPNEIYEGKLYDVSQLQNPRDIRKESKKCQHLCSKCHVEETISREKGNNRYSILTQSKRSYVNGLKLKGCSSCGYVNSEILRFFEFDHLNPELKIDNIATMVNSEEYSLDDIISECVKCRVLCKHCHVINTKRQRMIKKVSAAIL